MNHLKEKTSGIDCEVQDMQKDIYNQLVNAYGFQNVEGYGRLYRNELAEGVFPQWYDANTKDYRTIYLDDTKNVILSFIDGEDHRTQDGITYVASLKVVFWFNLDAIDPGEYRDAHVQRMASAILKRETFTTFEYRGLQKGVRNVYSGFNVNLIKRDNLNPFHVFSLNIDLTYQLTKICN